MTLPNKNPTELKAWEKLISHYNSISNKSIYSHFKNEKDKRDYCFINWEDFYVDVSKNRWNKKTFDLLIDLAKEAGLKEAIEKYFNGTKINETENRAVLHTAIRKKSNSEILIDNKRLRPSRSEVYRLYASNKKAKKIESDLKKSRKTVGRNTMD